MRRFLRLLFSLTVVFTAGVEAQDESTPIPQAAWSKEGTRPIVERMSRHTDGITSVVLHHTQSPNEVAAFQRARLVNVQRYHIVERGWGDIAYHYLIGSDGKIFEGRSIKYQGDSGTSYDLNGRLLICVLGDFTRELPSDEALRAVIDWIAVSLKKNGLTTEQLVTHRMVAATDCPGDRLQAWFDSEGKELIEAKLSTLSGAP